jgi:hypothetical protein
MTMKTVWAMLGSAFYLARVFNGWVRIGSYDDGHGLMATVRDDRIMKPAIAARMTCVCV